MMRRLLTCLSCALGGWVLSASAGLSQPLPDLVHLPNFLGRYICLGINDAVAHGLTPKEIVTTRSFAGKGARHVIKLDESDSVTVEEAPATLAECSGLPMENPQWNLVDRADFCLKVPGADRYVRVQFSMNVRPEYQHEAKTVIFSVGAYVIGDGGSLSSGDTFSAMPRFVR
jgi:hypothetical protein